jgi:quinohemoprotein ethanol dehydrogenase
VVYAVDARKGNIIWKHDPRVDRAKASDFCCGVVNRGVALYQGAVFVGTLDGRLLSLDAATGDVNWSVMTIPEDSHYSITGAPRIADGKVLIGNGGAEFAGVRGYVTAYDAATGKQAWRFYTVPGNPDEPFENPALEHAAKTWTGEWWKQGGGGTVWDSIVYDPELRRVYIGVGNGSHWNRNIRSPFGGDNLYLSSIVALDVEDGSYQWHFQTTPGDTWDYTATQQITMAEIELDGERRKVLMQAPKNGFFYVLDRETGEFISGDAFSYINWAEGLDESGRPIEREGARYDDGRIHWILPSSHGAHNWFPMAFSQRTGLMYIPGVLQAGPYVYDPIYEDKPVGAHNITASFGLRRHLPSVVDTSPEATLPGKPSGELIAYDPVKQERRWAVPHSSHYNGGVLATAGGLVLQGDAEGYFSIRDDETGEILKQFDVRTGVIASPVTYLVDGEQYVTLLVEWGGGQGQTHKKVDRLYPGSVYTFKLGGKAAMPVREAGEARPLTTLTTDAGPIEIGRGYNVFIENCFGCHSHPGAGGGALPDLARSEDATFDMYETILLEGGLAPLGMPDHGHHLDAADVANFRAFVLYTAEALRAETPRQEYNKSLAAMQKAADEADMSSEAR